MHQQVVHCCSTFPSAALGKIRSRGDGKIEDYSNQITDKIKVLNDIAFQTNLLAFQASKRAAQGDWREF